MYFKHAFPIEDGAIHGPRGRYFLPIFAAGDAKEMTKRTVIVLIAVAAVVTLVVLSLTGALSSDEKGALFEHSALLAEQIGSTPDAVYTLLSEKGEGLVEVAPNLYTVPGGGAFAGTKFAILLHFDEKSGRLDGYDYVTKTKSNLEQACKDVYAVLHQFAYDSVTLADGSEFEISKKGIREALKSGKGVAVQISDNVTTVLEGQSAVERYVEELESADYWEGRIGEYLVREAFFYRDVDVRYDSGTQDLDISIRFAIEADRDKN